MIEFITYYFLLLVYTQFGAFKKFRTDINFRFIFILTIVSLSVFIYTCYKILTDENYFFKINIPDYNNRKILLLFFVATFISALIYFISKYVRELSDKRIPQRGSKGIRGKRGDEGKTKDDCDPIKCKREICNKKYLIIYPKFIAIF